MVTPRHDCAIVWAMTYHFLWCNQEAVSRVQHDKSGLLTGFSRSVP
jgi:hypothetical protein